MLVFETAINKFISNNGTCYFSSIVGENIQSTGFNSTGTSVIKSTAVNSYAVFSNNCTVVGKVICTHIDCWYISFFLTSINSKICRISAACNNKSHQRA